jgi:hypothetical protein
MVNGRDDDEALPAGCRRGLADRGGFLRGVVEGVSQSVDRGGRHLQLHHCVPDQFSLWRVADPQFVEPYLGGLYPSGAQDYTGRPAGVVEIDCFEPPLDARAGEHHNRVGSLERMLDDEISAGGAEEESRD